MKKKILLFVAIMAVLVCVLAVSISAAEPSYKDGEWIYAADGTTKLAIRDTDGNPLIWYMNGEELKWVRADQTDETQSVYVKYTITGSGLSGFQSNNMPVKALKEMFIVDNGITFKIHNTKDSAIVLFNMEKLDIDAINGWFFGNKNGCCTNMRGVVFPSTLKQIGTEGFTNTKLVQAWNFENTQLEYLAWGTDFAATSTFTQEATDGVFKIPNTYTKQINVQKSKIKVYISSANATEGNTNQTLRDCDLLEYVYMPGATASTGFGDECFRDSSARFVLFMVGTEQNCNDFISNTGNSYNGFFKSNTIVISYEEYLANKSTYDDAKDKIYMVYGYNGCDAFYDGEHNDIGNSCVIECERCDDYDGQMKKNPAHNYVDSIAYTNYLANGTKTQTCQNEGCAHNIDPYVTSVNAIVSSFKGISTKEEGDGLTFGYTINYEALDEYVAVNGEAVELGFVVAVQAFLGEAAPLNADGTAVNEKVVKATVYNSAEAVEGKVRYAGADFVLRGNWDGEATVNGEKVAIKDVVFCMAGYIIDGDTVAYINANASGNKADTVYYNQYVEVTTPEVAE